MKSFVKRNRHRSDKAIHMDQQKRDAALSLPEMRLVLESIKQKNKMRLLKIRSLRNDTTMPIDTRHLFMEKYIAVIKLDCVRYEHLLQMMLNSKIS